MELHVGDTVRYLNEVGGGKVTKILSATMVEIIDDSGFQMPVLQRELICVESAAQSDVEPNVVQQSQVVRVDIEEIDGNDTPQFFLGFVRNIHDSKLFDVYIINDCNFFANSIVLYKKNETYEYIQNIVIEPNTKVFVSQVSYDEISTVSHIALQSVLFKTTKFIIQEPVSVEQAISPVKFYKPGVFTVNDFFEEDAYVIDLFASKKMNPQHAATQFELEQLLQSKIMQDTYIKPQIVQEKECIREVDLHIHELVDNELGLDAAAKLDIQMQTFEKELAQAMKDGVEKIVFIHGVGNGVLKAKIRGILDRDYSHLLYQDASFQKYKFGATLIYLKGASRKRR